MERPEKHRDDTVTADLRPVLWFVVILIALGGAALLLKRFGVF